MNAPATRFVPGRRLPLWVALALPIAAVDQGTGWGWLTASSLTACLLVGAWLEHRRLERIVDAGRKETSPAQGRGTKSTHADGSLTLTRTLGDRVLVGTDNDVSVRVSNDSPHRLTALIRDDLPDDWSSSPSEVRLALAPGKRIDATYRVHPLQRGPRTLGDLHVRLDGAWGLGALIATVPAQQRVRVYPNLSGLRRFELASRLGTLQSVGVRPSRQAGGGGELAHLREYVAGDPYRDVDWKSTAKRRRAITRVYEQERSQQVMICIDVSRMMATPIEGVSKLEHAISAGLVLAWAALRQGDRVGLIVFGDTVKSFIRPKRGPQQYRSILETLASVQAAPTSVDFRRLIEHIQVRLERRSLLVVFSDLLDASHARPLAQHAPILRRKHLPLCVTMNDPVAEEFASAPTSTRESVFRRAAAADVLEERQAIKARLRKAAVDVVEAPASVLAVSTVNRYLEIKARRIL